MAPLSAVVSRGVPTERNSRSVISQQIAAWSEVDPVEYLEAFDLRSASAAQPGHAVYATCHKQIRILIPALVILRAFFRPTRYLLAQMFEPQALDHVRYLDYAHSPPQVEFYGLTWRNLSDRHGDLRTPISWMSVFPSAMRFAASVHLHARSGRVAVTLPNARVKLAVQGRRQGSSLYATNATLLEIDALEEPMGWVTNHSSTIYRRAPVARTRSSVLRVTGIPSRSNGHVEVTDAEWTLIEPILLPTSCSRRRIKLDQRGIFDGILRKLLLGSGWKSTPYTVGSHTHALYAYRRWMQEGSLDRALAVVRQHRSTQGVRPSC